MTGNSFWIYQDDSSAQESLHGWTKMYQLLPLETEGHRFCKKIRRISETTIRPLCCQSGDVRWYTWALHFIMYMFTSSFFFHFIMQFFKNGSTFESQYACSSQSNQEERASACCTKTTSDSIYARHSKRVYSFRSLVRKKRSLPRLPSWPFFIKVINRFSYKQIRAETSSFLSPLFPPFARLLEVSKRSFGPITGRPGSSGSQGPLLRSAPTGRSGSTDWRLCYWLWCCAGEPASTG